MPKTATKQVTIRPDRKGRRERVTVVFAEDQARRDAIEGLGVLDKAYTGKEWGYSIMLRDLGALLALPQFQGVQPDMDVMTELNSLNPRRPAPARMPPQREPKFHLPQDIDLAALPGITLRDWQVEDLYYIEAHDGLTVIGHERGVGKTPVGLAWAYHMPQLRPAIFVVPANVKRQWYRRLIDWLGVPEEEITVIKGRTKVRPDTPYILLNWDILSNHAEALMELGPRLVEYDELARGKNSEAKRTENATALAHFRSVESRLGLTGTEYMNRPDEGWPQDHIINPDVFPERYAYRHQYCNPTRKQTNAKRHKDGTIMFGPDNKPMFNYSWDFSGASNLDELNRIRRQRIFVRRTKKETRPEAPDILRETVPLEVNLKEYKEVDRRARQRLKEVKAELRRRRVSLQGLTLEQQEKAVAEHAEADSLVKLYGIAWGEMSLLRQAAGLAKVAAAAEWCQGFLEEQKPLLIFAHHHPVSDGLRESLNETLQQPKMKVLYPGVEIPRALDGRMTMKRRDYWADKFIAGDLPILPAGLMAMSEGYDGLQHRASHLAILELGWNPSIHDQAEGRLDRDGQDEEVNSYYLIALNTFDEDMSRVCDAKNTVVSASYGEVPPPGIIESLLDSYLGD